MIVGNPGIIVYIKKNLENRICAQAIFGIKICTGKTQALFGIKILYMGYAAAGTNPVV